MGYTTYQLVDFATIQVTNKSNSSALVKLKQPSAAGG